MYNNPGADDGGSGSGEDTLHAVPTSSWDTMYDTTNGTMTLNETSTSPQASFRYLGITFGIVVTILGTLGNGLTIIAFFKNRGLRRNFFNLFIVNLSAVDLLTASCMMPFNVAGYVKMQWPFGNDHVTCSLQAFFYFCCGYTSVVCLLAIAMNRFVGIVFPDRYVTLYSSKWASLILFVSWIIAPVFLLPSLIKAVINNVNGTPGTPTGWKEQEFLCTFVHIEHWGPYMQMVRVVFQFLPLLIMIVVYVIIWQKVRESNRRLCENAGSPEYRERIESARQMENTGLNRGYDSPVLTQQRHIVIHEERVMLQTNETEQRNFCDGEMEIEQEAPQERSCLKKILNLSKLDEKTSKATPTRTKSTSNRLAIPLGDRQRSNLEQRLMYVSVIICVAFTVLFLPSLIINLLPPSYRKNMSPCYHMAASNLTWLNCCVNPLVYVALHRRMRREYKKIIKRCMNSLFSLDHH